MKITTFMAGAASLAMLAACANNSEPMPRENARVEPRPAPITSPSARELPPRETARAEPRVAPRPAPRTADATPVITGPAMGEMNIARLIGTDVKDPAGQTIGEIDNVLLDSSGRVESVIVTVGGFMGFGGRDVELQWADLKRIDAGNEVRVEMTAMQLRQRPEYQPGASGTVTTSGTAP